VKWVKRFFTTFGVVSFLICTVVFYDIWTIWKRFKEMNGSLI